MPTIDAKTYQRYAADPAAFKADLIVDVSGCARRYGDVEEPWQVDHALDQALLVCAGRAKKADLPDVRMRLYKEIARGHTKTTSLAMAACYALAFATRPIACYSFAVDKEQAALIKAAVLTLIRLNPWLGELLEVQTNIVVNHAAGHPANGAKLTVSTSDVASSWGILPSLVICDEFTMWEGDGSLWHSIISSAAKREDCLVCVATNAGFCDSWQHQVVEVIKTDPAWNYHRLEGVQASWMKPQLAEMRRMLPPIAWSRLFESIWSTGGGDALTPDDIAAAFDDRLAPMTGNESEELWSFVAGIDLGLTRDCSAVVVLAVPSGGKLGRIRLASARLWRPTLGRKIDLTEVERHVLDLDTRFNLETCAYDSWQAEHLSQRLERLTEHRRRDAYLNPSKRRLSNMPWMREVPPTAANLRAQATTTIEAFQDRRLQLYPYEPLRRDLLKLRVEEKSYGVRLVSPRDGEGHGDTFSAFALALLAASELAGKKDVVAGALGGDETPFQRAARQAAENFAEDLRIYEAAKRENPNSLATALRNGAPILSTRQGE